MSEELLEMRGIEVECFGVDIGKDRGGTDVVDYPCGSEEGEARNDHLGPWNTLHPVEYFRFPYSMGQVARYSMGRVP